MFHLSTRVHLVLALAVALPFAPLAAQADTLPLAQGASAAHANGSATHRLPVMALAAVSAATFNQALGSPKGWSRTWGGYGRRLGDQVGFAAIEEGVRLSLGSSPVKWVPDTLPCRGRTRVHLDYMLPASVARSARGATAVLRNAKGRARPNFPLRRGRTGGFRRLHRR